MGYYIQTGSQLLNKADWIVRNLGGKVVNQPQTFADIPDGQALICVVGNFMFEACGLCFDQREFDEFTNPRDTRPKQFVLLDKKLAYEKSGYKEKP